MSMIYTYTKQLDDFPRSRFEIWIYEHYLEDREHGFYSKNCHIWRDGDDKIIGLFISEDGDSGFHLISHQNNHDILEVMLSWLFGAWASKKDELWTELSNYKKSEAKIYAQKGFMKTDSYSVTRTYNLEELNSSVKLPKGFYIESADKYLDISGHVELIKNAFNKKFYKAILYERLRIAPGYSADLDITIYSPEGAAVSTCKGWVDTINKVAEIETVGTHCDYRRLGLARAAVTVCLQRLKEKGYRYAFISSLNDITHNFYDSFPYENRQISFEYTWKKADKI
jgi:hypothetical protein